VGTLVTLVKLAHLEYLDLVDNLATQDLVVVAYQDIVGTLAHQDNLAFLGNLVYLDLAV
jgi:hypothetical protein